MQENTAVQETKFNKSGTDFRAECSPGSGKQRLWRQSACRSTIISLDR